MKFWISPAVGSALAAVYAIHKLRDQFNIGAEHATRASGTVFAWMLLGAFIGLAISMLLASKRTE
jgi:hypothetical protein